VNERSRGLLAQMSRLPTFVVPLLVLILMVTGVSAPPIIGLAAFFVLLAFVSWLAYLSWPALDSRGRLIRVGLILLVFLSAALQAGGWF
jgi:Family of unknown function (DUF6703)